VQGDLDRLKLERRLHFANRSSDFGERFAALG